MWHFISSIIAFNVLFSCLLTNTSLQGVLGWGSLQISSVANCQTVWKLENLHPPRPCHAAHFKSVSYAEKNALACFFEGLPWLQPWQTKCATTRGPAVAGETNLKNGGWAFALHPLYHRNSTPTGAGHPGQCPDTKSHRGTYWRTFNKGTISAINQSRKMLNKLVQTGTSNHRELILPRAEEHVRFMDVSGRKVTTQEQSHCQRGSRSAHSVPSLSHTPCSLTGQSLTTWEVAKGAWYCQFWGQLAWGMWKFISPSAQFYSS